ncbi:LOW QUALITY PROTEIN: extracellular superoxide dismutase [Cu-Zn] [Elgaria multicarinata webbii]|uniref:LOW QUALITY PROTEIN: extracellular superoxide dismutase [Cu-Zn] n=1 Tax=Elgaria multicarinata webbii TaxID=159646 RepID=UPI002FCD2019
MPLTSAYFRCLLLFLAVGLILCECDVTGAEGDAQPTEESPLHDMQKKINDLWLSLLYPQHYEEVFAANRTTYATCAVKPNAKLDSGKLQVTGHVLFRQAYPYGKLEAIFYLDGFPTESNLSGRAIHVHQYGDLSDSCDSAGGHYNPFKVNHPRHPGDFGNFNSKEGKIRKYKSNLMATLFGPYTIIGRSVVVHEQDDDLGKGNNKASLENGNAGKRLACCVIGTCNKNLWEKKFPEIIEKRKKGSQNERRTARPR